MSPTPRRKKRLWWLVAGAAGPPAPGRAAAAVVMTSGEGDVSNPDVAFVETPRASPSRRTRSRTRRAAGPPSRPTTASPGRSTATRRRARTTCRCAARCARRSAGVGGDGPRPARVPARALRAAAVPAEEQRRAVRDQPAGRPGGWKRKLGSLAASSPACGDGTVYVTLLERFRGSGAGRGGGGRRRRRPHALVAQAAEPLGVLAAARRRPPVLRLRGRHGLRAARVRRRGALAYKASGRRQGRAGARGRQAVLRRLRRPGARDPPRRRRQGLEQRSGAARSASAAGNFYSSPAVAYGRVYIGSTTAPSTRSRRATAKLAWRHGTGGYVYASPAVGPGPGGRPDGLRRLLRRPLLRARRPLGRVALDAQPGPQDLGRGDAHRRPRLRLRPRRAVDLGARRRHRARRVWKTRPRRVQPGDLRRAADLLQRLLVPVRARPGGRPRTTRARARLDAQPERAAGDAANAPSPRASGPHALPQPPHVQPRAVGCSARAERGRCRPYSAPRAPTHRARGLRTHAAARRAAYPRTLRRASSAPPTAPGRTRGASGGRRCPPRRGARLPRRRV